MERKFRKKFESLNKSGMIDVNNHQKLVRKLKMSTGDVKFRGGVDDLNVKTRQSMVRTIDLKREIMEMKCGRPEGAGNHIYCESKCKKKKLQGTMINLRGK